MHITYGHSHQGIDALSPGLDHGTALVLARLNLPEPLSADLDRYTLHPSLLDSALQASIGLGDLAMFPLPPGEGEGRGNPPPPTGSMPSHQPSPNGKWGFLPALKQAPTLPFAVGQVDILGPCTPTMWAVLREAGPAGSTRKLDIDLCDEVGHVRVRIRGYTSRVLQEGGKRREGHDQDVTSAAKPSVRGHPLIDADVSSSSARVFTKCFSHRDSILHDHVFDGVRVLPAAALIEMAREAVERIGARPGQITNFLMGYPIVETEHGINTRLVLKPVGEHIDFTLTSRDHQSGQPFIHCQGTIETGEWGDSGVADALDLDAIRARLPHRTDLGHHYDG
jgi:hypothetical protein